MIFTLPWPLAQAKDAQNRWWRADWTVMEVALAVDLIRSLKFQPSGGCTGSQLDQALEILIGRGGCANSQLDPELEFLITLALRQQLT